MPRGKLQKQADFVPSCLTCCDKGFYSPAIDSCSRGASASLGVLSRLCSAKGCSGFAFLPCPEQLLSSSFRCWSCLVFFWTFFIASGKVQRCHVRWAAAVLCCRGRRGMCTRLLARYVPAVYFSRDHLECLRPDFPDNAILFGTQFWFWEFMDRVLGLTAAGFPLAWEHLKIMFFSCKRRNFFSEVLTTSSLLRELNSELFGVRCRVASGKEQ